MNIDKLDKTIFSKHIAKNAGNDRLYWLSLTSVDRVGSAWRLSCRAYNLDPDEIHKLDRSIFKKGKQHV
jgi:hypothetical protein